MSGIRISGWVVLVVLALFNESARASDIESNKALVHRFVTATNELDYSALDSIVAPDMVRHSQSTPGLVITSLADFKAFLERDAAMMEGAKVEPETMVAEGNRVAIYGTFSGTHTGSFGPIGPTGKTVSLSVHAMFRIKDERIVEIWVLWDNVALLTQLGHSPFAPPAKQ